MVDAGKHDGAITIAIAARVTPDNGVKIARA
jgi:hypothetical protein